MSEKKGRKAESVSVDVSGIVEELRKLREVIEKITTMMEKQM